MTKEELIKLLKKLAKGEYWCGDMESIFLKVAKKSEYTVNPLTGDKHPKLFSFCPFAIAFDEYKYGLEYATNGKISYVGTNDLMTLTVR